MGDLLCHEKGSPYNTCVAQQVFFLNTVLSLGCSLCILIGLWPFRGLFHAWFYKNYKYDWPVHTMMGWFDVGCWGLFATNVQALTTFVATTGQEAYNLIF